MGQYKRNTVFSGCSGQKGRSSDVLEQVYIALTEKDITL